MSLQGIEFGTPGTGGGSSNVPVPDVTGDLRDVAEQKLKGLGFKPNVKEIEATGTQDEVVAQDPAPSTVRPKDSEVRIFVIAAPSVVVPDVVGKPRAEAEQVLKDAGLKPFIDLVEAEGTEGEVAAQDPVPGTKKPKDSPVRIFVVKSSFDFGARFTQVDSAVKAVDDRTVELGNAVKAVEGKVDGQATALGAISTKLDSVATAAAVTALDQSVTAVGAAVTDLSGKIDGPVTAKLGQISDKLDKLTPPAAKASAKS